MDAPNLYVFFLPFVFLPFLLSQLNCISSIYNKEIYAKKFLNAILFNVTVI